MEDEALFKKNMYEHQHSMVFGKYRSTRKKIFVFLLACLFLFLLGLGQIYRLTLPPTDFPIAKIIEIPDGTSIQKAGIILKEAHVIQSVPLFQTFAVLFSNDKGIRSGFYSFEMPISAISVAEKLSGGKFGIARVKVTFPEGITIKEMGGILQTNILNFNSTNFVELAKNHEGYMFPNTYFFFKTVTPEEVITTLTEEFNKKIEPYKEEIATSNKSLRDIIIMASIIEKESNGKDDYETISGILWNRLNKSMRLQVDATFIYTLGKGRGEITPEDIKADTSAYNTYINDGLPPTPIGNPGLRAILAALRPATTPYLFYLHEKDGTIHYAKTFDEHKKNIQKYLR